MVGMSDEQETPPAESSAGSASTESAAVRGRPFKKGQSGNPGGRPKALKDVQELAAAQTEESVRALVTIMRRGLKKPASAQRMSQARQAAVALLDRAWGKPAQPISGVPGQPIGIEASAGAVDEFLKKIAGEE